MCTLEDLKSNILVEYNYRINVFQMNQNNEEVLSLFDFVLCKFKIGLLANFVLIKFKSLKIQNNLLLLKLQKRKSLNIK